MQFRCTIIINQARNNEYNAKKITTCLFGDLMIDYNQIFYRKNNLLFTE